MGILKKLKDTFLPSEKTAAARREAAFGSESKGKAAAIIVGGAAAAVVAGAAVGLAGAGAKAATSPVVAKAATSVGSSVVNVVKANPIKSAIIAPIVGLQLATNPKARKAAGEVASQTGGFIVDAGTSKSLTDLKEAVINNPYGAAVSGLVVAGATAGAIYYGTKTADVLTSNKDNVTQIIGETTKKVEATDNLLPSLSDVPTLPKDKASVVPSDVPLTPEVIPLGKAVTTTGTKKISSSKYKRQAQPSQMMRITINNQNRTAKFIKIAR
jgi:hypothetical protein